MYRYLNIINPFFNFKPIVYENLRGYKKNCLYGYLKAKFVFYLAIELWDKNNSSGNR